MKTNNLILKIIEEDAATIHKNSKGIITITKLFNHSIKEIEFKIFENVVSIETEKEIKYLNISEIKKIEFLEEKLFINGLCFN